MGRKRSGRRRGSSKAAAAEAASIPPPNKDTSTSLDLLPSKSLYLFCAHYPGSSFSYTLYKINLQDDIILSPTTTITSHPPQQLSPVLKLEGYNKYPAGMRCALLDSKLYILGGELRDDHDTHPQPQHHHDIFPPDVYQFDITTNEFNNIDAPLHTGKPGPCVFAAGGKIYALGTKFCPNLYPGYPDNLYTLLSEIKLFECLDPKTKQWQVLDNPPVNEFVHWNLCNVLEQSHQVVVCGWEKRTLVVLVYDLRQQKWRRYVDLACPGRRMAISFQEADHSPHHLYGILSRRAPVKANMELLRELNVKSDNAFVELCIPDISRTEFENIFDYHPYVLCIRRLLRYVGDGCFCYMTYGMLPRPDGPDRYGYTDFDSCCQGTTITLFKEISHDHDDTKFQAKILHHQEYEMRFPSDNVAKLIECFVVSHDYRDELSSDENLNKFGSSKVQDRRGVMTGSTSTMSQQKGQQH